ncbi:polyribonucleotide nucleotidyltransferase [Patescibacteria group bacterium]|nr:polyribonucleotide nucleotidyltransferase [Patescibacteria group bacterium]
MSYPKYGNTYKKDILVGDKVIHLEIGKFSEQVSAAVLATCGETIVHTTVALGRKVNLGYFPLSVEFVEKLYAGGIIKGSRWVKRDGRPTEDSILRARVIDRTMRPLFPEGITNEVQAISTVLSYDGENEPDMMGLLNTAIALQISDIPFDGPVSGMRLSLDEKGEFIINPLRSQIEGNDLDLIVSASANSIVMVEAGANEVAEDVMVEALLRAQDESKKVCQQIETIVAEIGKEKVNLIDAEDPDKVAAKQAIVDRLASTYKKEVNEMTNKEGRLEKTDLDELIAKILEEDAAKLKEGEESELSEGMLKGIFHDLMKAEARRMILEDGIRPDGRTTTEIRPIWCEVDLLPRVHGSAMFKRGATQALTVVTLGDPSLGQLVEDMAGEKTNHYFHHYNMPPYASGEAGRIGYPKRREIGHGALAQRAIEPMLPSQEDFPYTIHVVSEIMSSNGSTSQASVCGSTLSLMAAGVPLKKPVSGIAMGLMSDGEKFVVLSDIQGLEDHVGDMDFKVAGTKEGITAIQMDIKLKGIPKEVLVKALGQAREGRMHIMGEMLKCISEPRTSLSVYAPKVAQITIPAEKIGGVIGSGGSVIKDIIEKSGAEVNVEEDKENKTGVINVSSPDQASIDKAIKMIEDIVREINIGDEFDGTVTRVEGYGMFVEYLPGREGLVHVSNMSSEYVKDANDLYKVGDSVHVRVKEYNPEGKVALTMLSAEQEAEQKEKAAARGSREDNGRSSNGGYNGGRRYDNNRGGDRRPSFGDRNNGGGRRY